MERSLSDVQHRLTVKTNELHAAQKHIGQLEERLGELLYMDVLRGGERSARGSLDQWWQLKFVFVLFTHIYSKSCLGVWREGH